ncbi:hypothetical protein SAMN05216420_10599 [Nitrosospira sp. Nl5]|nr:hypothetical protein SAMN05216420_10599 [Nitrosospira sp. Nl5]
MAQDVFVDHNLNWKMSGQLPDLGLRMFIPKKHLDTDELPLSDLSVAHPGIEARRHVAYWGRIMKIGSALH